MEPTTRSLFDPVRLGRLYLPNRVVMGPMSRARADIHGVPPAEAGTYYAQRAAAGLIITESTYPSRVGNGYLGSPGLHSRDQVEGWRTITETVHAAGGRIFVQLMHCGRIGHRAVSGRLPVAPSPIRPGGDLRTPGGRLSYETPHPLTESEIADTVREFAEASRLAIRAGFDGVELHGGNGYLIHQFLAAGTNRRTDGYGTDRTRFAVEVGQAVAAAIGADRVGFRLSPGSRLNSVVDDDAERTCPALVQALGGLDLAYLHLTGVDPTTNLARRLRGRWPGRLLVAPGSGSGAMPVDGGKAAAQAWLDQGADLVAFGRAFLANPDLVDRFRSGASLNLPDRATYYGGSSHGYTDYPRLTPDRTAQLETSLVANRAQAAVQKTAP